MRIAVMGAGAVGGYFGGRLAQAGETVAFVARGGHLGALQAGGLQVRSVEGDFTAMAPATDDPARVPALIGPVDLVLFCVKLYDTEAAARRLRPLLAPHTAVLSLQNGVAKDAILADALGAERILGGQCNVFVSVEGPGVVRHAGGGTLAFGELDGRTTERATGVLESARKAGLRVELSADIRRVQWEKYLMILGLSAMSAVTRRPMGEIRACPESRRLYQSVFEKVVGVTSPNSVTDVLVRYLSRKLTGDAENGIRRAFLGGFQSQVAALKTGQTVAFTWTLEGIYDAEKQGVGKFLLSFGDEIPDFAFEAVIATRKMIEERPEAARAFLEGVYEAVGHMKANKDYTVAIFERKMDTPKDIGARVWDFDAHKLVDDGLFNDKALLTAAQAIAETGAFAEPPPLAAWVDKRFLPVVWKR